MSVDMVELDLADLVPLTQERRDYVLEWRSAEEEDGHVEVRAIVVMKRPGGFLLALPVGALPDEDLAGGTGQVGGCGSRSFVRGWSRESHCSSRHRIKTFHLVPGQPEETLVEERLCLQASSQRQRGLRQPRCMPPCSRSSRLFRAFQIRCSS